MKDSCREIDGWLLAMLQRRFGRGALQHDTFAGCHDPSLRAFVRAWQTGAYYLP
jgi:hypothetical protein